MANNSPPVAPVAPDGMEILFFYQCPDCGKHVPVPSPTEARLLVCDACHFTFPIIPVDETSLHYMRIIMAGGRASADQDFL